MLTDAFLIYKKSLEVIQKQLDIFAKPEIPQDIKDQSLTSVLPSCISAFDGLGKELRRRKPTLYPDKPKNLFQNILLLNEGLDSLISTAHSNLDLLVRLFQVRHLYEHNMGVVDDDFVKRLPKYSNILGRKYLLTIEELNQFLVAMDELGVIIEDHFKKASQ